MFDSVKSILAENEKRKKQMASAFVPLTGEGSIGTRTRIRISDFAIKDQWIPDEMLSNKWVAMVAKAGSFKKAAKTLDKNAPYDEDVLEELTEEFIRIRIKYDFPFWAILFVLIKPKGEGDDIPFRLNRQQRRLVTLYESQRKANRPIRVVLAKSRQWGGSTVTQIYIAWLQLVHGIGMNSIIVGHQKDASAEVEGMYKKLIEAYPTKYLYKMGEEYSEKESKWAGDPHTQNIHFVPQRKCKIKIGTAEKPDSARGGDSTLVHCTEVAFWRKTEGKKPEQIVRAATAGTLPKPMTMIVYESSPNGSGNFFQREYDDAKAGRSMFASMFVAWWDIETYTIPFASSKEREVFAKRLFDNRLNNNVQSVREQSGKYLYWLFEIGASLEAIKWYIEERKKYTDHADMASEFPSDDVEAFSFSGARVFDKYKVNLLKSGCRPPKHIGEVQGYKDEGKDAFRDLKFIDDPQGQLWIWQKPEKFDDEEIKNRYLVVVDIGGRSSKADYSVIAVYDRYWMMEGDKPEVVAQWYGHIDMDLLAWKSAQIASYYNNALLVIESNTLETKDRERMVDGDQSEFILNQLNGVYNNMYARRQSEAEIAEKAPKKYGFHTNVATKPMIISTLVKVVRESMYVERDERVLDEFLTYEKKQNGAFGAILGKHDDLLMTRAIGLHICFYEMPIPVSVTVKSVQEQKFKLKKKAVSAATMN